MSDYVGIGITMINMTNNKYLIDEGPNALHLRVSPAY